MSTLHQVDSEDACFLFSERLDNPAHLSLLALYDQSPLAGQVVRFQNLRQLISNRLQTAPVLQQKLRRLPIDLDYPYWVDDTALDIDYHVRHLALPQPGDWRQFCIQVARLHSRPLDTRRPLWEIYVIEGLNAVADLPPGSFAIHFKVHHCAMDQPTGLEFLESLHESEPNPVQHEQVAPRVRHIPVRAPTPTEMAVHGLWGNTLRLLALAQPPWRQYRRLGNRIRGWAQHRLGHSGEHDMPGDGSAHFSSSPSSPRVFEGLSVSLDLFERLYELVPGSRVEHAVTLLCTEATRRYLLQHGLGNPQHIVATMHLAARHASAHALAGNARALQEVETYCTIENLVERLTAIASTVDDSQELHADEQGHLLRAHYEGLPAPLNHFLGRHSEHGERFGNAAEAVGIQVARGPEDSLYLLGARLAGLSNLAPLLDNCSLVYSATTCGNRIHISFTSESEKLAEPRHLKAQLQQVIDELCQEVGITRA